MSYTLLKICIVFLGFFTLILYGYIIYENGLQLQSYKNILTGSKDEYAKLLREYQSYKQKTQNLREVTIIANNHESKNISVGDTMSAHIKNIDGDVSIYYKNLTTDESVVINGDQKYYMASLYKVILTLYILDRVQKGEINLTDKTPNSPVTVEQALEKIITESNNEFATALANEYGWGQIETYMKSILGISFSFESTLQTDVKNMGILFEEISLSLKIPKSETTYLLNLLKDQKRTTKLPKYLPQGIYAHNKTGEYESYSHDAGIFYTAKANYILIFMSKTPNPGATNEEMAKMSLEIYNILNDIK